MPGFTRLFYLTKHLNQLKVKDNNALTELHRDQSPYSSKKIEIYHYDPAVVEKDRIKLLECQKKKTP